MKKKAKCKDKKKKKRRECEDINGEKKKKKGVLLGAETHRLPRKRKAREASQIT